MLFVDYLICEENRKLPNGFLPTLDDRILYCYLYSTRNFSCKQATGSIKTFLTRLSILLILIWHNKIAAVFETISMILLYYDTDCNPLLRTAKCKK